MTERGKEKESQKLKPGFTAWVKRAVEATPKMTEEEVEALKTKISQLEDQQKQARDLVTLLAAMQKQDTPGAQATPLQPETRQLVEVPNEHRLKKI